MATTLHLIVPGLLGPWPFHRSDPAFPQPSVPALAWLLSRAYVSTAPVLVEAIQCQLYGFAAVPDADLPIAALTRLADGGDSDEGWWWRADPVHFHADLHGVMLSDARSLAIQPSEAEALAAAFNHTFAADGLRLDALRPERWYLRLASEPAVQTHSLAAAAGRDIRALLPYGPDKAYWHKLLTEVQMLFHTHPVNQRREHHNQPLISGIWLWGGGYYPSDIGTLLGEQSGIEPLPKATQDALSATAPSTSGLYANDPLSRGLARWVGEAINPVPENAADWFAAASGESASQVMLETLRYDAIDSNYTAWSQHLLELEQHWFQFCQQGLKTGRLAVVHLYPGNGHRYSITSRARWRFWNYSKPLATYLD